MCGRVRLCMFKNVRRHITGTLARLKSMSAYVAGCAGCATYPPGFVGPQYPSPQRVWDRASSTASTLSGLPAGSLDPSGTYLPPAQVRLFDPAFFTPEPHFAVLPYAPSAISVMSPVLQPPGAFPVPPLGPDAYNYPLPPVGLRAGQCRRCTASFSPLPPSGFRAWEGVIRQNNLPNSLNIPYFYPGQPLPQ